MEKLKIAIILGTRPEAIRLYHTVQKLKDKVIYWTGQNFEKSLSTDILNDPLLIDAYDSIVMLSTGQATNFSKQFARMIEALDLELNKSKPDKVLILGDTNSALAGALVAKKRGILLYHMEAGNRCYDSASPEEVNRKLIDSIADVHMCYTKQAKQNLLFEGVPQNKIHIIGNPIAEFKEFYNVHNKRKHILVTCHRKENEKYIENIIVALLKIENIKIIACIHPRYEDKFKGWKNIECIPSASFSSFIKLEQNSSVIVTDSGTVCEEAAILGIPSVITRKTTERPELFDHGCTILSGVENSFKIAEAIQHQLKNNNSWSLPEEYLYQNVSDKVLAILMSERNCI